MSLIKSDRTFTSWRWVPDTYDPLGYRSTTRDDTLNVELRSGAIMVFRGAPPECNCDLEKDALAHLGPPVFRLDLDASPECEVSGLISDVSRSLNYQKLRQLRLRPRRDDQWVRNNMSFVIQLEVFETRVPLLTMGDRLKVSAFYSDGVHFGPEPYVVPHVPVRSYRRFAKSDEGKMYALGFNLHYERGEFLFASGSEIVNVTSN